MKYNFFAMISRMKYIKRWALMRNSREENLSEHSLEVAMLVHALAVISNRRLGNHLDVSKAALIAIYHDSSEIITGDMPTPIKYHNLQIQSAFKDIEKGASKQLLSMLPEDLKEDYESVFFKNKDEEYLWRLVKAADKLSALIKCMEERKTGNTEFINAENSLKKVLKDMELKEVEIFMKEFLPGFEMNLDELN
ncbi:5'-deoxynucleotidase [Mobilisporobacter senegalensis]|uniref:5'-deoxynucleotidase n=1 Tax=Mobilisporobacter senegalensis TaxID=1329262 RepID=A0A3N1Y2Y1_9FIRM|nr:5'-deoxynucleotidase [Mobilisporobacter senegalensis]ROR31627.1 5'-deoxynucleotidase [Mobilisporobacter senegalensis]